MTEENVNHMDLDRTADMPFRFLDLPLEIQRMILAKYYEEPWWVQPHDKRRPPRYRHLSRAGYRTSLSRNPLLVSHHFYHETRLAIRESRGNTFNDNATKIRRGPAWFDPAITQVDVDVNTQNSISAVKARFPNLEKVTLTRFPLYSCIQTGDVFSDKDLGSILQGEHDNDIAELIRQKIVADTANANNPLYGLGETTLGIWIESEELRFLWGCRTFGVGRWIYALQVYVEMRCDGACVMNKRFSESDWVYRNPTVYLEASEEGLRSFCSSINPPEVKNEFVSQTDNMDLDGDEPFRFLDLPLEIQRNVFSKYYEEPWEAKCRFGFNSNPGSTHRYHFTLSSNVLLVCHHFHREVKLAISESRGNTYNTEHYGIVPGLPTWFDAAITTVISDLSRARVSSFKKRFPNLETIQTRDLNEYTDDTENVFKNKDLWAIVRGEYDQSMAEDVRQMLLFDLLEYQPEQLHGVVLKARAQSWRVDRVWDVRTVGGGYCILNLSINISEDRAWISGKQFILYTAGEFEVGRLEATEANLVTCCNDETVFDGSAIEGWKKDQKPYPWEL